MNQKRMTRKKATPTSTHTNNEYTKKTTFLTFELSSKQTKKNWIIVVMSKDRGCTTIINHLCVNNIRLLASKRVVTRTQDNQIYIIIINH